MTLIRFKYAKRTPTGELAPLPGTIVCKPTTATSRDTNPDTILPPVPVDPVTLINGYGAIELEPTTLAWAWEVTVTLTGYGKYTSVVSVPNATALDFTDLQTLDPATLAPNANPEPAWWGALYAGLQNAAPGPQGEKGDKGDKGDTGTQGPRGRDGLQGPAGQDGASSNTEVATFVTDAGATQTALDARYPKRGENGRSIKEFGAVGDGATDDTVAFQNAANAGGIIYLSPNETYVINSVNITKDVRFMGQVGNVFKRKANTNITQGSYWVSGVGMFEIAAEGLRVEFSDFTFDGNSTNQPASEPVGAFLKTFPPPTITGLNTSIHINRGRFINGVSNYLVIRGDDVQRRYETYAFINDCRFFDTVYGKGKGDPGTPSALGFAPTYILVMDYVRLRTNNFHAEWAKTTGTGQYAACAINGTYYGGTYANSGESSIYMHGTTFIKGLGRSNKKYDDTDWTTNNGIGAIDMYGNVDTLFVEKIVGINSQFVTVRAKGSIKNYTVVDANLTNCQRGLQVGVSSTGTCEAVVKVGNFTAIGGGMPQLEFIGTSTTDRLKQVTIDSAHMVGPFNNQESLATQGVVHCRNTTRLDTKSITIITAILIGMTVVDVKMADIRGLHIDTTSNSSVGLYVSGGDDINVSQFNIKNTVAAAVNFISNPKKIAVRDGQITNSVDYGVFSNTTTSELLVQGVEVDTVTGLSRAFYVGGGNAAFDHNKSNATTHIQLGAGTRTRQRDNTWQPSVNYATAAPATGTYSVGDMVYNTAAAASGTVGWVCTTAGTPGTWKTFGTIAA